MIRPIAQVAQMAPYALADLTAPEGTRLVSLAQNESLRGPSQQAIAAAAEALHAAHLYPDPDWTALKGTLAALHGVAQEAILCGSGSLDLIGCIARTYLSPGDAALAPAHAYPFFATATQLTGARFDHAPERDLHEVGKARRTAKTCNAHPLGKPIPDCHSLRASLPHPGLIACGGQ
ncbi:MAG: aminotransferase class I/II-fold pyridoxal phosphate-dependent enzyme, partial [Pseudomonadota bacterium]